MQRACSTLTPALCLRGPPSRERELNQPRQTKKPMGFPIGFLIPNQSSDLSAHRPVAAPPEKSLTRNSWYLNGEYPPALRWSDPTPGNVQTEDHTGFPPTRGSPWHRNS